MATRQRDSQGRFTSNGNGKLSYSQRVANREFKELVENALLTRSEFLKKFLDPRRSIDDECGYPRTGSIMVGDYQELFDRESIATRVVEVLPKECWQTQPDVFENEDMDNVTEFEDRWNSLGRSLTGDSWFESEETNPVWEYLLRADILSGIGSFGIMLIGIDDGQELNEPIEGVEEVQLTERPRAAAPNRELIYLRVFPQSLVDINRYETDITNRRFGQPVEYSITFNDPTIEIAGTTMAPQVTKIVHWTRVVHIVDNLGSSEVFGVPRMQPVFNRLYDLRKLYGGSAEMYWRGAFPGLSFETHPQLGTDVRIDSDALKGQMEDYMNGLQRYLAVMGMSVKSLAPQVVDPASQIDAQITAICVKLGIPKRIFMGSERGELASTQDDSTWNDRLRQRQNQYLTPRVIAPFVDRLIKVGVLPVPEQYTVKWPDLESLSEDEQATIAGKRTEAMAKYIGGNVESLMVPIDYLTREMHYSQDEAKEIVDAAMEVLEEKEAEEAEAEAERMEMFQRQQAEMSADELPTEETNTLIDNPQ